MIENVPKSANADAQAVIDFWFSNNDKWFVKSTNFDQQIINQFGDVLLQATQGELSSWRCDSVGRLAEIIVLDQFSRNVYRDSPKAFAQDGMALVLAQEALTLPSFAALPLAYQKFTVMPFMHSESAVIHEEALMIFTKLGDEYTLAYEQQHKAIIDQFGRYPHRNAILGRQNTPSEEAFLKTPNSSF